MKNTKDKGEKIKSAKIGDRIWLRIPHNGVVEHVFKDGSVRVKIDEITKGTIMERLSLDEISIISPNQSRD